MFKSNFGRKAAQIGSGLGTALLAGAAFAQTATPADQVVTSVTAAGADAQKVAVAVVLALWGITAIYLLRRKG